MNLLSSHRRERVGIEWIATAERKNLSYRMESILWQKNQQRKHIDEAHSGKFTNKSPCMNW